MIDVPANRKVVQLIDHRGHLLHGVLYHIGAVDVILIAFVGQLLQAGCTPACMAAKTEARNGAGTSLTESRTTKSYLPGRSPSNLTGSVGALAKSSALRAITAQWPFCVTNTGKAPVGIL